MSLELTKLYPEMCAGAYSRDDGGVHFFSRVNALLRPQMTVMDLGAGRGVIFHTGANNYYERLARLQGKVERVIGVDVDDGILDHPYLDERHVVEATAPLPAGDESVDLVVSDWVLEHIVDPEHIAAEIERVLKPGGWFCARTPSHLGYVGTLVRLIPNAFHTRILRHLQPWRAVASVFPTFYRLNSRNALNRYFPPAQWRNSSYTFNPAPKYYGNSNLLFHAIAFYQRLTWGPFKTDLYVFLQKLPQEAPAGAAH